MTDDSEARHYAWFHIPIICECGCALYVELKEIADKHQRVVICLNPDCKFFGIYFEAPRVYLTRADTEGR